MLTVGLICDRNLEGFQEPEVQVKFELFTEFKVSILNSRPISIFSRYVQLLDDEEKDDVKRYLFE